MNSSLLIELIEILDENHITDILDLYIHLRDEKGLGIDEIDELNELENKVNELESLLDDERSDYQKLKYEYDKLKEKINE